MGSNRAVGVAQATADTPSPHHRHLPLTAGALGGGLMALRTSTAAAVAAVVDDFNLDDGLVEPVARPVPPFEPPLDTDPDSLLLARHTADAPPTPSPLPSGARVLQFPESKMREPAPDPTRWAGAMILATLEAVHGVRAPGQLRRWLAPPVHAAVAARAAVTARATSTPPRIVVRSVRVSEIDTGRVEAFGVVDVAGRCRAVALCLQTYDGRWRVTAFEIG